MDIDKLQEAVKAIKKAGNGKLIEISADQLVEYYSIVMECAETILSILSIHSSGVLPEKKEHGDRCPCRHSKIAFKCNCGARSFNAAIDETALNLTKFMAGLEGEIEKVVHRFLVGAGELRTRKETAKAITALISEKIKGE